MSGRFAFWLNIGFAALNLTLFCAMPLDWASSFNLGVGILNLSMAYRLRQHA
jgi:hypothetical protein